MFGVRKIGCAHERNDAAWRTAALRRGLQERGGFHFAGFHAPDDRGGVDDSDADVRWKHADSDRRVGSTAGHGNARIEGFDGWDEFHGWQAGRAKEWCVASAEDAPRKAKHGIPVEFDLEPWRRNIHRRR